jgi:hypothetical protein
MTIRGFLSDLGGRTWLSSTGFAIVGMIAATLLHWHDATSFTGGNWVAALGVCAGVVGTNQIKRAVEGNGR